MAHDVRKKDAAMTSFLCTEGDPLSMELPYIPGDNKKTSCGGIFAKSHQGIGEIPIHLK